MTGRIPWLIFGFAEYTRSRRVAIASSGGSDKIILKRGGAEDNISAPSSFIANAHNNLLSFYTEKGGFLYKKIEPIGGGPHCLPFESSTDSKMQFLNVGCKT